MLTHWLLCRVVDCMVDQSINSSLSLLEYVLDGFFDSSIDMLLIVLAECRDSIALHSNEWAGVSLLEVRFDPAQTALCNAST